MLRLGPFADKLLRFLSGFNLLLPIALPPERPRRGDHTHPLAQAMQHRSQMILLFDGHVSYEALWDGLSVFLIFSGVRPS
jgi:hypothetical protein